MSKQKHSRSLFIVVVIFAMLFPMSVGMQVEQVQAENSRAECVMDASSLRVLWQQNGDLRLPMASTTKIATALTVIEKEKDLDRIIRVPLAAVGIEGSSVYLKEGDKISIRELLYGLMLRSGNDCALALALSQAESIAAFSKEMNEQAEKAGALNSHFRNPHGLPCKNHYTTAIDLSRITASALQSATFQEIVSTKYYAPRNWQNKNKMLTRYVGAIGVKTGYTKEAGRCLVTAAKRGNLTLICTVLSCARMYERTEELLDAYFAAYQNHMLVSADEQFSLDIHGKSFLTTTQEDLVYPMLTEEMEWVERRISPVEGREKEGILGKIEIYLLKRLLFSRNLYKL